MIVTDSTRDALDTLTSLARDLQIPARLEELLQILVETASSLLDAPRASIRLLDPGRSKLMAVARAGQPLHMGGNAEFRVGEGLMGWIVEHGQPIRSADPESDPRFAMKPGMRGKMGSFLGVPIVSGKVSLGVVSAVHPDPDHFTSVHEKQLTLLACISAPYLEIARLSRLATVDPLTRALNRRGMDSAFPEVEADESGYVKPLSVVMVDLDHFKRVNDTHGHAVGDLVLKEVTRILSNVLRGGDAVIRYGGEEFLLVLPGVDLSTAARVVERARVAVQDAVIEVEDRRISVTASFGVAERTDGEDRETLISRADAALYRAKEAGRNCVHMDR